MSKFLPRTRVEGPGERACIWVQGCSIQCPGCAVPWTWPKEGGTDHVVEELAETIINEPDIEEEKEPAEESGGAHDESPGLRRLVPETLPQAPAWGRVWIVLVGRGWADEKPGIWINGNK